MVEKVLRYIRENSLIVPGDRVGVAVSGGADSVALLRILLELRAELGVVLAVAHFNHGIRGLEADSDEKFVKELAERFELEFHSAAADAPAYSREHRMSLETGARELRHAWFAELVGGGKADKMATAHTQDDQAETVLMRILRGTGARGLAGISPWQAPKALIRPLLTVTRQQVEEYLRRLEQRWREDSSNLDLRHTRNRIRHQLLPLLERDYNPAIRHTLADLAEVARAEEEYWEKELTGLKARLLRSGRPSRSGRSHGKQPTLALDRTAFAALPLATQRRLLQAITNELRVSLEFKHIQELLALARQKQARGEVVLPAGLVARNSMREFEISYRPQSRAPGQYCYHLVVPGEITVAELGTTVRAQIVNSESLSGYNFGLLERSLLASELTIRNWRAGDRFFPAHTRSPKKVKELLQAARLGRELSPAERKTWPVILSAGEIVWMRGFPVPEAFAARSGEGLLIEEVKIA